MKKIIKHHRENNKDPCQNCGCADKVREKVHWVCKRCHNEKYNAWRRKYRKTEGYKLSILRQSLAYGAA
jgi:uncharacterized paraquat-inducible protein A